MLELTAKNFGILGDVSVDLGEPGLVMVWGENNDSSSVDSNGSGKSTLFRALTWGLFGVIPETGSIIHHDAKSASVTVRWGEFIIERTAKRSGRGVSNKLTLSQLFDDMGEMEDITGATMADTQAEIHSIVGMTYDVWHNTVMYAQMDDKRFLRATDGERKALLRAVFDFDVLTEALKKAKAEYTKAYNEMSVCDNAIRSWSYQIEAQQTIINDATTAIHNTKAQRGKAAGVPVKELSKQKARIKEQIASAQRSLKALDRAQPEKKHADAKRLLEQNQKKLQTNDYNNRELRIQIAHARKGLEQLETSDECPTCGTPTDDLQDFIENKQREAAELDAELRKVRGAGEKLRSKGERLEAKCRAQADKVADVDDAQREIERMLTGFDSQLNALAEKRKLVDVLTGQMKEQQKRKKEAVSKVKDLEEQIAKAESDKLKHEAQAKLYEFWTHGFGIAGLQNDIFDQLTAQLTHWANEYLKIMTDGTITLSFDTRTALVSGKAKDKFAIHWIVEGFTDVILSQSQEKKISIAVDLALAEMIHHKNTAGILILDELFDSLDATSKTRVLNLLDTLQEQYKTIFVITHDSALSGAFETTWKVTRKNGKATVEA
jgi:DNA repair exonuclease SbcCD ATPase subunit